jgi:phytoene dehydrogenase-like protein
MFEAQASRNVTPLTRSSSRPLTTYSSRSVFRGSTACQAARGQCVVVGGGIGGLVSAAKLAQSGYEVTIVEQNPVLGGRCHTVSFEGCRFDTGPSLLLLPQVYRDTFSWLQSDIEEHVQLARVEPAAYRVWFADGYGHQGSETQGSTLDMFYDVQRMVQQLEEVEPGAGEGRQPMCQAAAATHP